MPKRGGKAKKKGKGKAKAVEEPGDLEQDVLADLEALTRLTVDRPERSEAEVLYEASVEEPNVRYEICCHTSTADIRSSSPEDRYYWGTQSSLSFLTKKRSEISWEKVILVSLTSVRVSKHEEPELVAFIVKPSMPPDGVAERLRPTFNLQNSMQTLLECINQFLDNAFGFEMSKAYEYGTKVQKCLERGGKTEESLVTSYLIVCNDPNQAPKEIRDHPRIDGAEWLSRSDIMHKYRENDPAYGAFYGYLDEMTSGPTEENRLSNLVDRLGKVNAGEIPGEASEKEDETLEPRRRVRSSES